MENDIKTNKRGIKNSCAYITVCSRKAKRVVILRSAIYIVIVCLYHLTPSFCSEANSENTFSDTKELHANQSADSKSTAKEQIAALKKEEIELAEHLMKKFPDSANAIMLMGNVLERHGDALGAIRFMNKVLELDPRRADIYKSIGWFEMQKGQYERAISNWRKALEINPRIPGMHNSIGLALLGLGKQDEAIEELEKDIEISPRSDFSYFMLGQVYLQKKEYEEARENYEKATALRPDYTNAYYGLFTVCTRLKQRDKAREYMAVFKKLKAEDMKKLKDRNEVFDDLVDMRKGAVETFMQASQIYRKNGDFEKAEGVLKRAANIDPENTICLAHLASLYQTTNRVSEALNLYGKISEMEPQNLLCYLNIGLLSTQLKRFDDAEGAFLKAISLAPKKSVGYRELAQLYLKTGTKPARAKELAKKAVKVEAQAINYFVLSWALDRNGDSANALKAIEQAVKLEPANSRYKKVYEYIKKKN
jgi:tetratricopeptide (TPR) repeat protein